MANDILRDIPAPVPQAQEHWGSDGIAAMLRALDIPYLALNPGASYRGLHDSIVNYLGNERPQMLLCLHEESAIAVAHGYARTTGKLMGAVVHSNVGLMHATMAIFNAWCDRVPMLILGATGPWDAARRRPWIDWIHTASDQGALVRDYTKWDNQPGSVAAAYEALMRAVQMANTPPRGPTYINLDAALQEAKIGSLPPLPDVSRFRAADPVQPEAAAIAKAAQLLSSAKNPAMLMGRVSRSETAWKQRIALAEKVQAKVFTDMKAACAFPTDHPLHAAPPATFPDGKLMCEPDAAVPLLLDAVRARPAVVQSRSEPKAEPDTALSIRALARAFNEATEGMDICLSKLPLGWNGAYRHFRHPLDYLGADGGGGVGAGPGLTVGSALALKGSNRVVVGIVGDGDFLMGNTAVWTAAHYKLPCLFIVANNRSFYNDEMHQERVAKERGRPVENKWIGQRIDEPDIDIAAMGRAQGAVGIGPVKELRELKPALEQGLKHVKSGAVCVIDVRVLPGYDAPMAGTPSSAARR